MTTSAQRARPVRVPSMPVLDLTMRIGDHLLASGMSANDVVVQMLRVTRSYGLSGVHVDLTYTSISVTHHRGPTRQPLTVTRVVQPLVVNYSKVREIDRLLAAIEDGLPIDRATAVYERISLDPVPYPHWVSALGAGGIASGATLMFSPSWVLVIVSFVSATLMERILWVLSSRRVPPFFSQAVVAGSMTMIAAGVHQLGQRGWWPFVDLDPSLIVVGGIVMLLAGVMIVGAVQDAIDQFYVTASARMLEVVMRTGGIVAGILVALNALEGQGVAFEVRNDPVSGAPMWAQFAGAAMISLSFAVYCYADLVTIVLTTLIGQVGWACYLTMAAADRSELVANTFGALAVGGLATLIVRRTHAPGFGMETGGLLPLVPGLTILNGLLQMMAREPGNPAIVAGGRTLLVGILVALGIATGATLGTYFGRPVGEQLRRLRRRVKAAGRVRPDRLPGEGAGTP